MLTTPRLPAGLLTGDAWAAIRSADLVAVGSISEPLARVVEAQGVPVAALPADPAGLLARASHAEVVWLAADDGDEPLVRALADEVVRRSEAGQQGPEIVILVASFDPVGARLIDLVTVMDRLRLECPWDRQQTHESLVRYLLEECYELIEAIESGDRAHLQEELGDVLLQVMFHARIATEDADAPFGIDDVAEGIVEKLVRRHPHVFAGTEVSGAAAVEANWESIKAAEKSRETAMDGISLGLPALSLAEKVLSRALRSKAPLSVPVPTQSSYDAQTLGDVLFALVAAATASGIDAEQALRVRVRAEMATLRESELRALRGDQGSPG
ncbi:MAG: MazG family protein [Nocardioidaceae bacterium]